VGAFEDFRRATRPAAGGQDVGAPGFRWGYPGRLRIPYPSNAGSTVETA
jgi:hypothetical protein